MTTPTDWNDALSEALSDYAAPVVDDGFADRVLAEAQRRQRIARWRVWLSAIAAIGTAAAIVAICTSLLSAIPLPELNLTSRLSIGSALNPALALILFAMVGVWMLWDAEAV